jgi:hypothetical protein
MTLSTSLRTAARNLINTFGNTASLYTYSGATTTENEEGDVTVTDWMAATAITVVDGDNVETELIKETQGMELMGEDDKIVRDDVTIAINDRMTINSVEFRVDKIQPVTTQDTVVVQLVHVSRVTDTSNW